MTITLTDEQVRDIKHRIKAVNEQRNQLFKNQPYGASYYLFQGHANGIADCLEILGLAHLRQDPEPNREPSP